MNYWKLGCSWGYGMPDFYSLLKEKWVVFCGDSPMAKGDWGQICQGYDASVLASDIPESELIKLVSEFDAFANGDSELTRKLKWRGVK